MLSPIFSLLLVRVEGGSYLWLRAKPQVALVFGAVIRLGPVLVFFGDGLHNKTTRCSHEPPELPDSAAHWILILWRRAHRTRRLLFDLHGRCLGESSRCPNKHFKSDLKPV